MAPTAKQLQEQIDKLKQDLQDKDARDHKSKQAVLLLDALNHRTMARIELLLMTARNIGTAYLRAAKRHRDALAAVDKIKALEKQIFYSVLTVLSSGALSWVWEAQNLAKMGKLLGPTLKDTLSAGAGEVFSANGPLYDPPDPSADAVNQEPQDFQNSLENRVSGFKITALEGLAKLADRFRSFEDSDWDSWDLDAQKKAFKEWQDQLFIFGVRTPITDGGRAIPESDSVAPPDADKSEKMITDMAWELERGFWAKWFPRLHSTHMAYSKAGARLVDDWESANYKPLEDRFTDLHILQEAGTELHWYQFAETEDRKLIDWAKNIYKPQPFMSN
jgi:hypothetical protein